MTTASIMGPSGTGKTTLLRHITGQLKPDAGSIRVDGQDVPTLARGALFDLRERIGFLFQNSALLTDFSVFENVAFPLRQHLKLPESIVRNIVLTKLQAVGLRGAADLMPSELSGGMSAVVILRYASAVGRITALSAASLNAYILRLKPSHGSSVRGLAMVQPAASTTHALSRPARRKAGVGIRDISGLDGAGAGVRSTWVFLSTFARLREFATVMHLSLARSWRGVQGPIAPQHFVALQ